MSRTPQLESAYIRGGPEDRVEVIHRRRRSAARAILAQFEELIEPLVTSGNTEAIENFKGVVRQKINGLAYEGIRAVQTLPGEAVSSQTADLAERLAFTDTED